MSSSKKHDALVDKIVYEVGSMTDATAWPNDTGIARDITDNHIIKYGLVGSSDVFAILNVCGIGVLLGFEAKTGTGQQSKRQRAFEAMIHRRGGFYFVVRENTDIRQCVYEARAKVIARIKSAQLE